MASSTFTEILLWPVKLVLYLIEGIISYLENAALLVVLLFVIAIVLMPLSKIYDVLTSSISREWREFRIPVFLVFSPLIVMIAVLLWGCATGRLPVH